MADATVFTVAQLKDKLKARGLSIAGTKNELIARLMEADLSETWMAELNGFNEDADGVEVGTVREREDALQR